MLSPPHQLLLLAARLSSCNNASSSSFISFVRRKFQELTELLGGARAYNIQLAEHNSFCPVASSSRHLTTRCVQRPVGPPPQPPTHPRFVSLHLIRGACTGEEAFEAFVSSSSSVSCSSYSRLSTSAELLNCDRRKGVASVGGRLELRLS